MDGEKEDGPKMAPSPSRSESLREQYAQESDRRSMSLDDVIFSSLDAMKKLSFDWLNHVRMEFKERHLKAAAVKQTLRRRRQEFTRLQTFLLAERDGKQAVKSFRTLPPTLKVVLNVGGRRFDSTLGALRRFRGSRLEVLFSTRYRVITLRTSGEYFFDRDPEEFRHTLSMLTCKNQDPTVIANLVGPNARPMTNIENDIQYFLSPLTKCEHIDLETVNIDEGRLDDVQPSRTLHGTPSATHSPFYEKRDPRLSDRPETTQVFHDILEQAYDLTFHLHRRFDAQAAYMDTLEDMQAKERDRLDQMEAFLKRAQDAFAVENAAFQDYMDRIGSCVELQVGPDQRMRVLTSKKTLGTVPGSLLANLFDDESPHKLKMVSTEFYRAPKYVVNDTNPYYFTKVLNYLRVWYPRPPPLLDTNPESRVQIWKRANDYGVRTPNWAEEWLSALNPSEQWSLHWAEVVEKWPDQAPDDVKEVVGDHATASPGAGPGGQKED